MTDVIEVTAKAMFESVWPDSSWANIEDHARDHYRRLARVALEANDSFNATDEIRLLRAEIDRLQGSIRQRHTIAAEKQTEIERLKARLADAGAFTLSERRSQQEAEVERLKAEVEHWTVLTEQWSGIGRGGHGALEPKP